MQLPDATALHVGTLNVRALSHRLGAVLALAADNALQILCLQESRLSSDCFGTVRRAAHLAGWEFHSGSQTLDASGHPFGGVCLFSRRPLQAVTLPSNPAFLGRAFAAKVHRPNLRPLLLLGVYLHASCAFTAASTLEALFQWAASTCEDWVVLGDFNLGKSHWPIASALASGALYDADAVIGDVGNLPGTHRNAAGSLTGSVIDYMLHSPSVHVVQRQQVRGVADHDLVSYSVVLQGPAQTLCWPRFAPVLSEAPVPEEVWLDGWQAHASGFQDALYRQDVDLAWSLLSGMAESCLCRRLPSVGRHVAAQPVPRSYFQSRRAPSFQSLRERQMRRLARQSAEFELNPACGRLLGRMSHLVRLLSDPFPSLLDQPWGLPEATQHVHSLAEQIAREDASLRIQKWCATTAEDPVKLIRWIKGDAGDPPPVTPGQWEAPAHPQLQADAAVATWTALWCPPQAPAPAQLLPLRNLAQPVGDPALLPTLDGEDLRKQVRLARNKAPGLDGWTAVAWLLLPDHFFECLASIWQVCLLSGSVPSAWQRIRITLIPKTEGGWRPIAIAPLAWRVGLSVILRQCRGWFAAWADPELMGGIQGRSIHDVHADLCCVQEAKASNTPFVGVKQDVRKCFDHVSPALALQVWEWLGAPRALVAVVRAFYTNQSRWFAVRGHFASQPVVPVRSVLQGCPASVGLLNGLMLLWVRRLRGLVPSVRLSIYLDDRTLWCSQRQPTPPLRLALQIAQHTDTILGLQVHTDKLASWATRPRDRRLLRTEPVLFGAELSKFKFLGVWYSVKYRQGFFEPTRITALVRQRTRRIARAARSLHVRRFLVSSLVVSLFSWIGPWTCIPRKVIQGWAFAIETAIGAGVVSARSRFLLWGAWAQPSRHPSVALAVAALRQEVSRVSGLGHRPPPRRPCPGLQFAMNALGFTAPTPGTWSTPLGSFPVGFLSNEALVAVAQASWLRQLWSADPKTAGPLGAGQTPFLDFHSRAIEASCPRGHLRRVLHAAAHDCRTLERMQLPVTQCECGDLCPTRTHVTFHCPSRVAHPALPARSPAENRLLVPVLSALRPRDWRHVAPSQALVQACASAPRRQGRVVVATDGSCLQATSWKGMRWFREASWAVVFEGAPAFAGEVHSPDLSPVAAERHALLRAVLSAACAGLPLLILCDCSGVVLRLQRGLRQNSWCGDAPGFWRLIRDNIPPGSECRWVPAHGRRPDWQPTSPLVDAATARSLNDQADRAAQADVAGRRHHFDAAATQHEEAQLWAAAAVRHQVDGTEMWHEQVAAEASLTRRSRDL